RARIVELLADETLCTCHLVAELDAKQTNISNIRVNSTVRASSTRSPTQAARSLPYVRAGPGRS
ncbi:hypothetical protein AB0J06_25710, partial [Micromonospora sp. NPDC049679]